MPKKNFTPDYWNELWSWYDDGGFGHVAAYLTELDISGFDPKAPPPKTAAFWDIVGASSAPEDAELADVIDALGQPACPDTVAADRQSDWRHRRMAHEAQEPPRHPASA